MTAGEVFELHVSNVAEDESPIEYKYCLPNSKMPRGYLNLTQAGVWVNRDHLRDDDVRLTVLKDAEMFTNHVPATPAEQMSMILLGINYEISR